MIHPEVLPQLEALTIDEAGPLLIVDVDEVLVGLAGHLAEFAQAHGFELKLTGYQLDGALKRGDGSTASPEEFRALFKDFFETQTVQQRVYPDAADVLRRLSGRAQIVILTNVPPYAEACRRKNLSGYGIDYPLVVNQGPKGGAVSALAGRTAASAAFIDDSPTQIASVAEHAPEVTRLHYVGDAHLRSLLDPLPDADHAPTTWLEIETILTRTLAA